MDSGKIVIVTRPLNLEYQTIKKLIQHDQYRARLFKMFPVETDKIQIHIYKIKNKGANTFDTFSENKLKPIIMTHPRNSFEREILSSYYSTPKVKTTISKI